MSLAQQECTLLVWGWEANSCATEGTGLQLSHTWETKASAVPDLRGKPSFLAAVEELA